MFVSTMHPLYVHALTGVQSFINGPVMFKTVGRHSFSAIQTGLFPIYFGIQTAVPVILALTYPSNALFGVPAGVAGVLHETGRWTSLLPLSTIFVTGLVNLVVLLPLVNQVMKDRRGQGTALFPHTPYSTPRTGHSDKLQSSETARSGMPRALTLRR